MTPPIPRSPARTTLRDLGEELILARILPLLQPSGPAVGTLVGPGDDAAVVTAPPRLVVTTDSMIRDRDWRDDWSDPEDVAHKLGAQNISDIAAMGGIAAAAVLSITADPQTPMEWVEDFASGLGQWCIDAGVTVVGGDLSSAPPEVLMVSLTMWGGLDGREPVLRSGARTGDVLAVCGSLGLSSAGLASYAAGETGADLEVADTAMGDAAGARVRAWRDYHRRPRPPWEAGPVAGDCGATSMIDLSDGLVRDLGRVAAASGVCLDLDRIVLERDFVSVFTGDMPAEVAWRHLLGGGEEHSLLATYADEASVPRGAATPWRVIGSVVPGEGVTLDGEPLEVVGWDHFAQQ